MGVLLEPLPYPQHAPARLSHAQDHGAHSPWLPRSGRASKSHPTARQTPHEAGGEKGPLLLNLIARPPCKCRVMNPRPRPWGEGRKETKWNRRRRRERERERRFARSWRENYLALYLRPGIPGANTRWRRPLGPETELPHSSSCRLNVLCERTRISIPHDAARYIHSESRCRRAARESVRTAAPLP